MTCPTKRDPTRFQIWSMVFRQQGIVLRPEKPWILSCKYKLFSIIFYSN
jgi:hypothetical protein